MRAAALGCLVFADPGAAIRCIGALARLHETPQALPAMADAGSALHLPAGTLSEQRSMALLAEAGVPVVPHRLVRTAAEAAQAAQAAQEMGGRIALKVCSDSTPCLLSAPMVSSQSGRVRYGCSRRNLRKSVR